MTLSLFDMLTCLESSEISFFGDVCFTHAFPVNRNENMMLHVLIFFSYLTCFKAPKPFLESWDDLCKNDRIVDAVKMIRFSYHHKPCPYHGEMSSITDLKIARHVKTVIETLAHKPWFC